MTRTSKFILSIVLMYFCIITAILVGSGTMCVEMIPGTFCGILAKISIFLIPCILFGTYLLWEQDLVGLINAYDKKAPQKFIGFFDAMGRFLAGWNNFVGRAQRSEFWWMFSVLFLLCFVLALFAPYSRIAIISLLTLISLPLASLWTRRLHDAGIGAKIFMIPYLIAFVLCCVFGGQIWSISAFVLLIMACFAILIFCALLPTKIRGNEYANIKESEDYNKVWINVAYIMYNIQIVILLVELLSKK